MSLNITLSYFIIYPKDFGIGQTLSRPPSAMANLSVKDGPLASLPRFVVVSKTISHNHLENNHKVYKHKCSLQKLVVLMTFFAIIDPSFKLSAAFSVGHLLASLCYVVGRYCLLLSFPLSSMGGAEWGVCFAWQLRGHFHNNELFSVVHGIM